MTDISLGSTIDLKFTTVNTSGVATTLAGSPVVAAYVGNSTTEITAGITLSVDFDVRTGLHNVSVVASSGNGFTDQTHVSLVLTAGTVGGSSVVGYVIGTFSIGLLTGLTAAQVAAEVRVNLASELAATLNTNTDIADVKAVTDIVLSKLLKYVRLITRKDGAVATDDATELTAINENSGSGSGAYANTTDAQEALRDRGDAAWGTATGFSTHSAADVATSVWAAGARTLTAFDASFKTGYALSAAGVQAVWDALTSALTTAGSIGKLLVDKLDEAISTRFASAGYTAPLDAAGTRSAVGLASANLDTQLTGVRDRQSVLVTKTATVQTDAGNSATQILTNLTETQVNHWKYALVKITSGTLAEQVRKCTGYDGAGTLTFTDGFTGTPADAVSLELIND